VLYFGTLDPPDPNANRDISAAHACGGSITLDGPFLFRLYFLPHSSTSATEFPRSDAPIRLHFNLNRNVFPSLFEPHFVPEYFLVPLYTALILQCSYCIKDYSVLLSNLLRVLSLVPRSALSLSLSELALALAFVDCTGTLDSTPRRQIADSARSESTTKTTLWVRCAQCSRVSD